MFGGAALESGTTYLRSYNTADALFCSVTDAHHIKEGEVVLFNAEVGYLLPLLACGVNACGVVRTACGSDQCVTVCSQCRSLSSQLWLLANGASLSKHMHNLQKASCKLCTKALDKSRRQRAPPLQASCMR